ncbi:glutathione S-transferase family protein [Aspergillus undulatus]|uniref:glutathione S-transferase family protein n=1 Tax=Aspergillus undulatus TaxID=1810928 RepID=UPI003CCCB293
MSDIKFFFASGACSLSPHILLHEAGLNFEPMQIKREETEVVFPPDYYKLNPKMRVPVIVVDGEIITESPAVCTIISQLSPGKKFMGNTPLETVRVYEWMNWISGTLHGTGYGHLFRPWRWTTSEDAKVHAEIKEKGKEIVANCFEHIESRLREDAVFAVGEELTAVDTFLYSMYRWSTYAELDLGLYSKFARLVRELEKRESVKSVLEKEGLQAISAL